MAGSSQQLQPTPDAAVDSNGITQFGVFESPFKCLNMDDAKLQLGPLASPRTVRQMRLKEWQHYWVGNEQFFFGLAVVDAKLLKLSFAYFVDRERGTFVERVSKGPFKDIHVPGTLFDDLGHFHAKDHNVTIRNHLDAQRHEVRFRARETKKSPNMVLKLDVRQDLSERQPLVVILPIGDNRGMYSHKAVLPANGRVRVGDREFSFDDSDTRCIIDIHKAHYPYRTWWRWATFWGWADDGREVGINLTKNVCLDDDKLNECAFWLDGELFRLGPAEITHKPNAVLEPWSIGTRDKAARLTFRPEGERSEKINMGLIQSAFHQPYGTFEGEVDLPTGETIRIDKAWGVAEDHTCRW